MAWNMTGTYFENCSCDAACPCTWSGLTGRATTERCRVLMVFQCDRGEVEGVDVSGLCFALFADTPPVMIEGDWRVGLYLDDRASREQAAKLEAVLSGEIGGPFETIAPLVGELLGVVSRPIEFVESGRSHRVRIGDEIDLEVTDFVASTSPTGESPTITGVVHPANSTLTIAPATRSRVSAFGLTIDGEGRSGFSAPFDWAA